MTSSKGTIYQDLTTKEQYIAQYTRSIYIASVCQPEAMYNLSIAVQAIEVTEDDIKILNKYIQ